jgi:hypothetical protein
MRALCALTGPRESVPFRSSLFPGCLLHAKAELRPTKSFKEAVLKTDAVGACGLALVRCGELAHCALSKESPVCVRMKEACSRESPQDADSLLTIMRDSLRELKVIKSAFFEVANVGSNIAAGLFNQGIEEQRCLVCGSTAAKSIRTTLELCKPSVTHVFGGDNVHIKEALEAVKNKSYQASSYRSKAPSRYRSSDSQEGQDRKKTPYAKKPYQRRKNQSSGKANGPASKKGEGQKKKCLLRETGEVVSGLSP